MDKSKAIVYLPKMGYATGEMPHLRKPPNNYMPGQNLYYLYTVCKNLGYEAKVVDGNWILDPLDEILKFSPEKILITSTTPCFKDAIDTATKLLDKNYGGQIYIGGPHVNLNIEERNYLLPKIKNITYIAIKNSITTFEWVSQVFPGRSIFEVLGLPENEAKKYIIDNIKREKKNQSLIELEPYIFSFFKPEFEWIKDTYNNTKIISEMRNVKIRYSIITSIGCSNKCTFCGNPYTYQINYKNGRIIRQILEEYKKSNINRVTIHDMFFFMSLEHARMILRIFQRLNMSFSLQTCLENLNEDLIKELSDAGVKKVLIGVENPFSKTVDKKVKFDKLFRLLDYANTIQIKDCFKLSYIVGLPDVDFETDLALIKHIVQDIKSRNIPLTNLQVNLYTPYRSDPNRTYIRYEDKSVRRDIIYQIEGRMIIFLLTRLPYIYWGFFPVGISGENDLTKQIKLCDIIYNDIYTEFTNQYLFIREKYVQDLQKLYPELVKYIPSFNKSIKNKTNVGAV